MEPSGVSSYRIVASTNTCYYSGGVTNRDMLLLATIWYIGIMQKLNYLLPCISRVVSQLLENFLVALGLFKTQCWHEKVLYVTSVQVIFVVDTVVSYYCIYYEYYLNRR